MPFSNEPTPRGDDLPADKGAPSDPPAGSHRPGRPVRWGRYALLLVWTGLLAGAYAVYSGAVPVDERFNPWAPLDVKAEPGFLTPYKLGRALNRADLCVAALAGTGMRYDLLPDRVTGPGCGFENAVRLRTAGVRFGAPLSLSCPMALSFAMWERHVLQPAAMSRLQQSVVAIDQAGSYACRNINTGEGTFSGRAAAGSGSRSRHATADALDVTGLTLANGKRISVLKNWQGKSNAEPPSDEALLLSDLHAGACKYFKGVLGPNYNAVHADHFHFETGGYSMCR